MDARGYAGPPVYQPQMQPQMQPQQASMPAMQPPPLPPPPVGGGPLQQPVFPTKVISSVYDASRTSIRSFAFAMLALSLVTLPFGGVCALSAVLVLTQAALWLGMTHSLAKLSFAANKALSSTTQANCASCCDVSRLIHVRNLAIAAMVASVTEFGIAAFFLYQGIVVSNPAGFDGRANYGMYSSIISQTQNNFFGPCTPVNQNDWTTAWNNGRNQWVASALNSFSSSFSGQTANAQTGLFLIFAASAGMMGALVHIALSVLSLQMVRSVKIVFSQASAVATAANPLTMVRDWTSGL